MLAKVDQPVAITLDGEPRGKGRPRMTKFGRAYTPIETRNYEAALRVTAQIAMVGRNPLECPVQMTVNAFLSVPESWPKWKKQAALEGRWHAISKPDSDNILKCTDALNGIVFTDDSQVVTAMVSKTYSQKPRIEIVVTPLTQAVR